MTRYQQKKLPMNSKYQPNNTRMHQDHGKCLLEDLNACLAAIAIACGCQCALQQFIASPLVKDISPLPSEAHAIVPRPIQFAYLKCRLMKLKLIYEHLLRLDTSSSDALPSRPGMLRSSCFCTCQIHVMRLNPSPPHCFFVLLPMTSAPCLVGAVLVVASFSELPSLLKA